MGVIGMQQEPVSEEIQQVQPEQIKSDEPEPIAPQSEQARSAQPEAITPQPEQEKPAQPEPVAPQAPRRNAARITTIILSIMAALVVIGGCSLAAYVALPHTAELNAQATTVASNVQATQTRNAVLTAPQYIYDQVTRQKPDFSDPLDGSNKTQWDTNNTDCVFTGGAYHLRVSQSSTTGYTACFNTGSDYSNFIFQVQMTIINGDEAGIIFRAPNNSSGYVFSLQNKSLYTLSVSNSSGAYLLLFKRSAAIHPDQPNLLAVMAAGTKLSIFINKQYVASIDDNQISSGAIGFLAVDTLHTNLDIAFNNVQVWKLP